MFNTGKENILDQLKNIHRGKWTMSKPCSGPGIRSPSEVRRNRVISQWEKILSSPHFSWTFPSTSHSLGLPPPPCPNSWSSLPPHTKARGTHTPLLPFWAWYPLMRPHGLDMAICRYHRRSDWSQNHDGHHYFSSWSDLAVEKTAFKSSTVSAPVV